MSDDPVISYWDTPLHATIPPSSVGAIQQFKLIQERVRPTLYSQHAFHEVDIPLLFRGSFPYVKAFWSGQKMECLVDTGTSTIMWPQWLHLDSQQLNLSRTQQWPNSVTTRTEWMFTPRITIGDFVLADVPTEAVGLPRPTPLNPILVIDHPILGMQAFSPFIVSIDYTKRMLVLRDMKYDLTRQPHSTRYTIIPYEENSYGTVTLPGTLVGHKATFVLDTGCSGIYINSSFAKQCFPSIQDKDTVVTSTQTSTHDLSGDIGGMLLRANKLYIMKRPNGPDVCLGLPFFSKYRVTIDRFRKLVLFEINK